VECIASDQTSSNRKTYSAYVAAMTLLLIFVGRTVLGGSYLCECLSMLLL